jgi:hypothetical protein
VAELWPGGPLTLPHTIVHDGVELAIPALPVTDLFFWLGTGQWWRLYPNAVDPETMDPLRERLFDPHDPFDLIHLHDVATRLFGRLAGMASEPHTGWWPALRLANIAMTQWPQFNAWCTGHNVTPMAGSLMTAVSAAYAWMRDGLYGEHLAKFEQTVWEVPVRSSAPTVEPEELPEHLRQEEASAFLVAMGEPLPGQRVESGVF